MCEADVRIMRKGRVKQVCSSSKCEPNMQCDCFARFVRARQECCMSQTCSAISLLLSARLTLSLHPSPSPFSPFSPLSYNWRAAVEETISATLNRTVSSGISGASYYTGTLANVNRSPSGSYVAVSSRGNFYLTWEPGQVRGNPTESVVLSSRGHSSGRRMN